MTFLFQDHVEDMAAPKGVMDHHKEVTTDHLKADTEDPKEVMDRHKAVITDPKVVTEHHREDMDNPNKAFTVLLEVITDLNPGPYKDGKAVTVKATKTRIWRGREATMPTQQLVL